jgi:hypothetical protein
MKKIILAMSILIGATGFAQNDEAYVRSETSKFTESLKNRGIDSFFVNERYCSGSVEMFTLEDGTMCTSKGTYVETYVFWEDEGKAMIKKIDNCGLYYSLPLENYDALNFYNNHIEALKTGIVKPYDVNPETLSPKARTAVYRCFREYHFYNDSEVSSQKYNLFDLTNDSDSSNLNYEYNHSLKVVSLDSMLDSIIETREPDFRRQKM